MAVVELAIEDEEYRIVVHEGRDDFCLWPFRLCVELFRVLVPPALVRDCDLGEVVVKNRLMEMDDELEKMSDE